MQNEDRFFVLHSDFGEYEPHSTFCIDSGCGDQFAGFGLGGFFDRGFFLLDLADLGQAGGFADAVAEVEQFGAAGFTAAADGYLADEGAVDGENSLDTLVVHQSAHGERFVHAAAFFHDDGAGENLDAFFFAFDDSGGDIDSVTHFKLKLFFFKVIFFDVFDEGVCHGLSPVQTPSPEKTISATALR